MSLKQALAKNVLIQDGSMGTQLEELLPLDHPLSVKGSPLWSTKILLQEPSLITQVHKSYLDVGSQMLITSTYQASELTLQKHAGLDLAGSQAVWQKSIDCAMEAIANSAVQRSEAGQQSGKVYIAASVGPYGAYLANGAEYSGDYDGLGAAELASYHEEMIKFYLDNKDVDVIAFETIPNFQEVQGIFELVKRLYSATKKKDFFVNLSCKDEHTLVDGTPLEKVVSYMASQMTPEIESCFIGTGCNCVAYEIVSGVIHTINSTLETLGVKPWNLIVYPNLGFENDMSDPSKYVFRSDTEGWKKAIDQWLTVPNIRIIGGCCSTGPRDIKTIYDAVYTS